jgi:hypothetical protein
VGEGHGGNLSLMGGTVRAASAIVNLISELHGSRLIITDKGADGGQDAYAVMSMRMRRQDRTRSHKITTSCDSRCTIRK